MIKRILSISVPYGFENGSFSSGASWCSASWRCSRRRDRRKRHGQHDSDVSGVARYGYGHGAHRRDIALRRGGRLRAGQILRQKSLDRRLYRAASQHGFGAPTFGARFAALFALARCRGDDDARYPMWVSVSYMFACRIALAYFFSLALGLGMLGTWYAMFADLAVKPMLFTRRYLNGKSTKFKAIWADY